MLNINKYLPETTFNNNYKVGFNLNMQGTNQNNLFLTEILGLKTNNCQIWYRIERYKILKVRNSSSHTNF